jgi:hypothetical protein
LKRDEWYLFKAIQQIVGAVLLDFSAAFDIIDQSAGGKTYVLWFYTPCYIVDKALHV